MMQLPVCCRYVPGAGDDEETWAQGLTPEAFWSHLEHLLAPGPIGLADRAAQVARSATRASLGDATTAADGRGNDSVAPLQCFGPNQSTAGARSMTAPATPVATDAHHLRPQGCRAADACRVWEVAQGVYDVVEAQVLLAGAAAARTWLGGAPCAAVGPTAGSCTAAGAILQEAGVCAVLSLCLCPLCQAPPAGGGMHGLCVLLPMCVCVCARAPNSCMHALHACKVRVRLVDLQRHAGGGVPHLWLPVASCKQQRGSLARQLPSAVAFLQQQLRARPEGDFLQGGEPHEERPRMHGGDERRRVLVIDDTGTPAATGCMHDSSVQQVVPYDVCCQALGASSSTCPTQQTHPRGHSG
jgi:hypothetical protein